jgi:hypothetical protein
MNPPVPVSSHGCFTCTNSDRQHERTRIIV